MTILKSSEAVLIVIDVQGKLAEIMYDKHLLFDNLRRLVQGMKVLNIPIIWMEQNPLGLGPTAPPVAELLTGTDRIVKNSFSCCGEPSFNHSLNELGRKQILLTGIETHICVYQTARDLIAGGYLVYVVTDAVSSRTCANRDLGIQRMIDLGVSRTGTEMALFELLGDAEGENFRKILRIIK
ncbi:hydrolase [bacterium]|nr:hydrolase [candidate division CSSED10-310 bacterium]